VLEVDEIGRGKIGVSFLARLYGPDVWHGDASSMCDVARQLAKLHVTPHLPPNITPEQKMTEKAMSFFLSDRNTPVIGAWASTIVEQFANLTRHDIGVGALRGVAYAHALGLPSEQYPNTNSTGWMDAVFSTSMPTFDREKFDSWLESVCRDNSRALLAPLCVPADSAHVTKAAVVVNGSLVAPKTPEKTEPKRHAGDSALPRAKMTPAELLKYRATQPCREYATGKCTRALCQFKH
jgi:hypothetical protein